MSPFEDLRGVSASVGGGEEEPLIAVEDAEEGMFESAETEGIVGGLDPGVHLLAKDTIGGPELIGRFPNALRLEILWRFSGASTAGDAIEEGVVFPRGSRRGFFAVEHWALEQLTFFRR